MGPKDKENIGYKSPTKVSDEEPIDSYWLKCLLAAIAKVKRQKQRPNCERISQTMRQLFSASSEETLKYLRIQVDAGNIIHMQHNGIEVYGDPERPPQKRNSTSKKMRVSQKNDLVSQVALKVQDAGLDGITCVDLLCHLKEFCSEEDNQELLQLAINKAIQKKFVRQEGKSLFIKLTCDNNSKLKPISDEVSSENTTPKCKSTNKQAESSDCTTPKCKTPKKLEFLDSGTPKSKLPKKQMEQTTDCGTPKSKLPKKQIEPTECGTPKSKLPKKQIEQTDCGTPKNKLPKKHLEQTECSPLKSKLLKKQIEQTDCDTPKCKLSKKQDDNVMPKCKTQKRITETLAPDIASFANNSSNVKTTKKSETKSRKSKINNDIGPINGEPHPKKSTMPICCECLGTEKTISGGFISCSSCGTSIHPICLTRGERSLVSRLKLSDWTCNDCRICILCRKHGSEVLGNLHCCSRCEESYHKNCSEWVQNSKSYCCSNCLRDDDTIVLSQGRSCTPGMPSKNERQSRTNNRKSGEQRMSTSGSSSSESRSRSGTRQQPEMRRMSINSEADGMNTQKIPVDKLSKEKAKFFRRSLRERVKDPRISINKIKHKCSGEMSRVNSGRNKTNENSDSSSSEGTRPVSDSLSSSDESGAEDNVLCSFVRPKVSEGGTPAEEKSSSSGGQYEPSTRAGSLFDGLSHLFTATEARKKPTGRWRVKKAPKCRFLEELPLATADSEVETPCVPIASTVAEQPVSLSAANKNMVEEKTANLPAGVTRRDFELFQLSQDHNKEEKVNPNVGQEKDPFNMSRCPTSIQFGRYYMQTWYSAPYPQEYARLTKLYLCEFCLKYKKSSAMLLRHTQKCTWRSPPGMEIYRQNDLSVYEVDGNMSKIYCQNLCLIAKLFLDHKTLYYDVEPFLFYVLTKNDDKGSHLVGYFSKEKLSALKYNISCIMTMPQYQRQGFGRFLIDFSYLLSKREGQPGTPEKPLSELGRVTYTSYWKTVLLNYLHGQVDLQDFCINTAVKDLAMYPADILYTLHILGFVKKDAEDRFMFTINWQQVEDYHTRITGNKKLLKLEPDKLIWQPLLLCGQYYESDFEPSETLEIDLVASPAVEAVSQPEVPVEKEEPPGIRRRGRPRKHPITDSHKTLPPKAMNVEENRSEPRKVDTYDFKDEDDVEVDLDFRSLKKYRKRPFGSLSLKSNKADVKKESPVSSPKKEPRGLRKRDSKLNMAEIDEEDGQADDEDDSYVAGKWARRARSQSLKVAKDNQCTHHKSPKLGFGSSVRPEAKGFARHFSNSEDFSSFSKTRLASCNSPVKKAGQLSDIRPRLTDRRRRTVAEISMEHMQPRKRGRGRAKRKRSPSISDVSPVFESRLAKKLRQVTSSTGESRGRGRPVVINQVKRRVGRPSLRDRMEELQRSNSAEYTPIKRGYKRKSVPSSLPQAKRISRVAPSEEEPVRKRGWPKGVPRGPRTNVLSADRKMSLPRGSFDPTLKPTPRKLETPKNPQKEKNTPADDESLIIADEQNDNCPKSELDSSIIDDSFHNDLYAGSDSCQTPETKRQSTPSPSSPLDDSAMYSEVNEDQSMLIEDPSSSNVEMCVSDEVIQNEVDTAVESIREKSPEVLIGERDDVSGIEEEINGDKKIVEPEDDFCLVVGMKATPDDDDFGFKEDDSPSRKFTPSPASSSSSGSIPRHSRSPSPIPSEPPAAPGPPSPTLSSIENSPLNSPMPSPLPAESPLEAPRAPAPVTPPSPGYTHSAEEESRYTPEIQLSSACQFEDSDKLEDVQSVVAPETNTGSPATVGTLSLTVEDAMEFPASVPRQRSPKNVSVPLDNPSPPMLTPLLTTVAPANQQNTIVAQQDMGSMGVYTPDSTTNSVQSIHGYSQGDFDVSQLGIESPTSISSSDMAHSVEGAPQVSTPQNYDCLHASHIHGSQPLTPTHKATTPTPPQLPCTTPTPCFTVGTQPNCHNGQSQIMCSVSAPLHSPCPGVTDVASILNVNPISVQSRPKASSTPSTTTISNSIVSLSDVPSSMSQVSAAIPLVIPDKLSPPSAPLFTTAAHTQHLQPILPKCQPPQAHIIPTLSIVAQPTIISHQTIAHHLPQQHNPPTHHRQNNRQNHGQKSTKQRPIQPKPRTPTTSIHNHISASSNTAPIVSQPPLLTQRMPTPHPAIPLPQPHDIAHHQSGIGSQHHHVSRGSHIPPHPATQMQNFSHSNYMMGSHHQQMLAGHPGLSQGYLSHLPNSAFPQTHNTSHGPPYMTSAASRMTPHNHVPQGGPSPPAPISHKNQSNLSPIHTTVNTLSPASYHFLTSSPPTPSNTPSPMVGASGSIQHSAPQAPSCSLVELQRLVNNRTTMDIVQPSCTGAGVTPPPHTVTPPPISTHTITPPPKAGQRNMTLPLHSSSMYKYKNPQASQMAPMPQQMFGYQMGGYRMPGQGAPMPSPYLPNPSLINQQLPMQMMHPQAGQYQDPRAQPQNPAMYHSPYTYMSSINTGLVPQINSSMRR